MGIKVEGETYIPGYFDMEDSSVNYNGNVLPYHKENKPSVFLTEKFTIIASNGRVHYDKEMIKRTMLVHEATFRKQVCFDETIKKAFLTAVLFSYSGI
jgi:hypothetical protein